MMKNRLFLFVTLCLLGFLTSLGQINRYDLNGDAGVNTGDVVSLYSYIITGEGDNPIPAPNNVKATVSDKTVTLTWSSVSGATYTVYRSADGKKYTVLANYIANNNFTDNAPLIGRNYYVVVSTIDGNISNYSSPATIDYRAEIENGLYLGLMCFNDNVYYKPISLLTSSASNAFNSFIDEMTMKNGTVLCYSVDQAIDALQASSLPEQLTSVAMVTFTDGIDRGSTMLNHDYDTDKDYLSAIKERITKEKVGNLNIEAYSIGLRGSDITTDADIADFKSTLRMLASSDDNAKEVSNMSEVNAKFKEIAEQLSRRTNRQKIGIKIPGGWPKGTRKRFTLDNASSAESSTIYIEGTFDFETVDGKRTYKLTDVTYNGMTCSSGSTVIGTVEGVYVSYAFNDIITTDNRMLNKSQFKEWNYVSDSYWQHNSEWDPGQQPDVIVDRTSALIMLVLDCSYSLGSQFSVVKTNAKNFISSVRKAYNNGTEASSAGSKTYDKKNDEVVTSGLGRNKYDINGDTYVNSADVVAIYNYIISGEDISPIPIPTNLNAIVSERTVILTWNTIQGATYSIYRSVGGKSYTLLAEDVENSLFADKNPVEGQLYYAVVANIDGEESNYSSPANVTYVKGLESGLYLGVMCFNEAMFTQPISLLTTGSKSKFHTLIDDMSMKNATVLCYSVDNAIDSLKSAKLPNDLSSVALVTFTDGLDNGSTMLNFDYESSEEYLKALNKRITNEKVSGFDINAYAIGLQGSDITTTEQKEAFHASLNMLASSTDNVKEVSNMAEVETQFLEIAEQLTHKTNRQKIELKIPGLSKGTKVRFTLDGASSAENSTKYIEGTFDYESVGQTRTYKLVNIKYNGMQCTSGSSVIGLSEGVSVVFSFADIITDDNQILKKTNFGEWDYKNTHWQKNSEWDNLQQSDVLVEKTSAVIMLVLDCSSSLGSQFTTAKTNAKNFISKLLDASSSGNDDPMPGPGPTPSDGTYTVNGVSFKMISVDGGTFQMGQSADGNNVTPVHSVTLSSYYIGQTEVTQALWKAVMGSNPSKWQGDNLPVEKVSWNGCQTFITKLNQLTGETFRLPTEAEWEFAAKGGNKSKGYTYSGSNEVDDVAWYSGNSSSKTHPVGTKKANELGIYDMSGNVWEWCQDWYGSYSSSAQTNPTGPTSGSFRVYRGGSWYNNAAICRTAIRYSDAPTLTRNFLGLRLAR